jgi:hypothetical protein
VVLSDVVDGTKRISAGRRWKSRLTSARFLDFENRRMEITLGFFKDVQSGDTANILVTPLFNDVQAIAFGQQAITYGYRIHIFLYVLAFLSIVALLVPVHWTFSMSIRYILLFVTVPVLVYTLAFDSLLWYLFQPIGF